jgi:hypothetical protein
MTPFRLLLLVTFSLHSGYLSAQLPPVDGIANTIPDVVTVGAQPESNRSSQDGNKQADGQAENRSDNRVASPPVIDPVIVSPNACTCAKLKIFGRTFEAPIFAAIIAASTGSISGLFGVWLGGQIANRNARRIRKRSALIDLRGRLHKLGYGVEGKAGTINDVWDAHLPEIHVAFDQWLPYTEPGERSVYRDIWTSFVGANEQGQENYQSAKPPTPEELRKRINAMLSKLPQSPR